MRFNIPIFVIALLIVALPLYVSLTTNTYGKDQNPTVRVETNLGSFKIELFPKESPITVENFLNYVDKKFYDGTIFHRVMADFMIQGGGFNREMIKKATGPPIQNEANNGLKNLKYTVAMARQPSVHSATSQFFVNTKDNGFLDHGVRDYGYAVFGNVVEGTEVIDKINVVPTDIKKGQKAVPVKPVVIKSIRRVTPVAAEDEVSGGEPAGEASVEEFEGKVVPFGKRFYKISEEIDIFKPTEAKTQWSKKRNSWVPAGEKHYSCSPVTVQLLDENRNAVENPRKIKYAGYKLDADSSFIELLFIDDRVKASIHIIEKSGHPSVVGYKCSRPVSFDQITYGAQVALKKMGYNVGTADGIWGSKTEAALRAFQKDKGLQPSGGIDSETKKLLWAAIGWNE